MRAEMWALQDELAGLRRSAGAGPVPQDEVHRLSLDIMDLGAYLTVLEARALEQHRTALEAREAYLAAGRRLLQLHRDLSDAIRADPRFVEAHAALRSALNTDRRLWVR